MEGKILEAIYHVKSISKKKPCSKNICHIYKNPQLPTLT